MRTTKSIVLNGRPVGAGAIPVICTPLIGKTPELVLEELAAILPKEPDIIEWRADFLERLDDTPLVVRTARALKAAAGDTPIMFTRRSASEGGQRVPLTEEGVVALYEAISAARAVDVVDYELANAAAFMQRVREASRANGIALVMSYHNFQSTPDEESLVAKFVQAQSLGADIGKVAVMPTTPADVLTLLAATSRASSELRIPLISMSMGAVGSVSRIVGGVFGSALTFAVGKASSAPGQIAIEELRTALATVKRAVGDN